MRNHGAVLNRALGLAVAGLLVFLMGCGGGKKAPTLVIATTTISNGAIGTPYSQSFTTTGGTPPVTWSVASGALPGGLMLSTAGVLSGTPTTAGDFTFTVQAKDSGTKKNAQTATRMYTLSIADPLRFTVTTLPNGTVGVVYNQTVSVTGGTSPYTWAPLSGTLPDILSLSTTNGAITGTPATVGSFSFTIQVSDSGAPQEIISQGFTIDVTDVGSLVIETSVLPPTVVASGSQARNYSATLVVSGETGGVTWSVPAGALPAGINLAADGVISGQATGPAAIANFTVRVVDTPGDSGERDLSIVVSNALGRNDTIANATPLSNGTFEATISIPAGDPGTAVNPDNDVFEITGTDGNIVSIEIFAERFVSPNRLDSVIAITDAGGTLLTTCRDAGTVNGVNGAPDPTPNAFDDVCMNDDINLGVNRDSMLELLVPAAATTFYVHVLDWNGTGRPDSRYQIVVSGAN